MKKTKFSNQAVNIETKVLWFQGREEQDFRQPATHWVFGKRFSGKSALVEALASNALILGSTVYDIFCARDSESLAWLDSPFKKVLLLCGDSVKINSKYDFVQMKDFDMHKADDYQLVITTPAFYSNDAEMYHVLTDLVDMLQNRIVYNKTNFLIVREARKLVSSSIRAGKVRNKAEAEEKMIDLVQEAYHAGLGLIIDSLRPMTVEINIREISNYVYLKRMGRLTIPNEFKHLMRHVTPQFIRKMPIPAYLFYTDEDNIAVKRFDLPYWHHKRGTDVLKKFGIKVEKVGEDTEITYNDSRRKVTPEIHKKIVVLRNDGNSLQKIGSVLLGEITLTRYTVEKEVTAHKKGKCLCSH